jgi:hypothetical protein
MTSGNEQASRTLGCIWGVRWEGGERLRFHSRVVGGHQQPWQEARRQNDEAATHRGWDASVGTTPAITFGRPITRALCTGITAGQRAVSPVDRFVRG